MQRPVPPDLLERIVAIAAQINALLQALGVDEPEDVWDQKPDSHAIWAFRPFDGGIN